MRHNQLSMKQTQAFLRQKIGELGRQVTKAAAALHRGTEAIVRNLKEGLGTWQPVTWQLARVPATASSKARNPQKMSSDS